MIKKLIGIIASIALILSLAGANVASALTAADISMLQAAGIINATQAAFLSASIAAPVVTTGALTSNLTIGSKGDQVTALQQILVNGGYLVMPAGVAYGYFGALTKSAVIKYQLAKGITPAVGYVGSITRASMNGSAGGTTGGTTGGVNITGTDLKVSLAATSPASSALIAGQAAANLAEYTFTNTSAAPAVVINVTLQRMGVSADTSLDNVYLFNGAIRLTDSATVSSGKVTFNSASGIFTIPAGSSMTVAVKADINSTADGQLIAIALTDVKASVPVVPVPAAYPISGASMSIFSTTDIARATSTLVSTSGGSISAGSLNQTLWSTSLSLAGRAVYLKSLALKIIGSIPTNSLQNVKLFAAGIQVASAAGMDANGMVTFDLTTAPYKIDSSRTLEVRADVVNGSSRTFSVQLQNASDLQLIDSNYNVGIAVVLSGSQSNGTWTVSNGTVSVQSDPSLAAGNVVTGATNVALARYTLKAYGEDMKISYLQASSTDQLDNVALYANGLQIGSTRTISTVGSAVLYSLGSSLIIPAGQTVTVEIRGDIKYNGTNATTTSNTIVVALSGYASNAQGSYSQQLSTVPSSAQNGVSMTVVGAGLTVAKNGNMSNMTSTPSVTNLKIGSYVLQANSSESVRVTNLTVTVGGNIGATSSLSNLYVSASGVNSTPISPESSNNFSVDFTIPANSSQIVDVYADVNSNTGVASTTLAVNGYGTGSNITIASSAITGQTITVGAGTLAVPTLDVSASPAAQLVIGGSSALIANYNFVSTNGTSNISEMYFDVTGTAITSVTVAGNTYPVVSGSSTVNGINIAIPVGYAGTNIPVTVKYATIGLGGETTNQTSNIKLTGFKYTAGNNTVSTTTLSVSSYNMYAVAGKPIITIAQASSNTGIRAGDNQIIARITITPDSGPIAIQQLPIKIVTSQGASTTAATAGAVKVGSTLVSTTGGIATVPVSSSGTSTITFTGSGYSISAPTTFDIYGKIDGFSNAVADPSISVSIASSTQGFVWADINGNATTTGQYIPNFPTNSVSINY
jgi:hypothetical protein